MLIIKKCLRCNHEWRAFSADPLQCPKCKSRLWNREDKRKGPKEFKERNRPTMYGIEKLAVGESLELPFIRIPGKVDTQFPWNCHDDLANDRRNKAIYSWAYRNNRKFSLEGKGLNLLVRRIY